MNSTSDLKSVQGALAQAKLNDRVYSSLRDATSSIIPKNPESLKRFLKENNMSPVDLAVSVLDMVEKATNLALERIKTEYLSEAEKMKNGNQKK